MLTPVDEADDKKDERDLDGNGQNGNCGPDGPLGEVGEYDLFVQENLSRRMGDFSPIGPIRVHPDRPVPNPPGLTS